MKVTKMKQFINKKIDQFNLDKRDIRTLYKAPLCHVSSYKAIKILLEVVLTNIIYILAYLLVVPFYSLFDFCRSLFVYKFGLKNSFIYCIKRQFRTKNLWTINDTLYNMLLKG